MLKSLSLRNNLIHAHVVLVENPEDESSKFRRITLRKELLVNLDKTLKKNGRVSQLHIFFTIVYLCNISLDYTKYLCA